MEYYCKQWKILWGILYLFCPFFSSVKNESTFCRVTSGPLGKCHPSASFLNLPLSDPLYKWEGLCYGDWEMVFFWMSADVKNGCDLYCIFKISMQGTVSVVLSVKKHIKWVMGCKTVWEEKYAIFFSIFLHFLVYTIASQIKPGKRYMVILF